LKYLIYQRRKKAIRHLLFLILLLICVQVQARTKELRLQNINQTDHLSQSYVSAIFQDSRGFMWFGTKDGLNRYDGHTMRSYKYDPDRSNTLNDNVISCLQEDEQKRLWIGTDGGGLNYLDLVTEEFYQVGTSNDGKQERQIWDLQLDLSKSQLWVASWQGVFKVDLQAPVLTMESLTQIQQPVRSLTISQQGLYAGCENGQLLFLARGSQIVRQLNQKDTPSRIYQLLDQDNKIFIGSAEGLLQYDQLNQTIHRIKLQAIQRIKPKATGLIPEVTDIIRSKHGTLWVSTTADGLYALNPATQEWINYPPTPNDSQGLTNSGFMELYLDRQGLIWIATKGAGVQYFDPDTPFKYLGYQTGYQGLQDASVRAILEDSTYLLIGGYNGLDRFSLREFKHYNYNFNPQGLLNNNIYALTKDVNGSIIIGTEGGGLYRLDTPDSQPYPIEVDPKNQIAADHIFELFLARDSTLLIGTGAGLYRLSPNQQPAGLPQKISTGSAPSKALDAEGVYAITQMPNGNLCIGTESNGVFVLNSTLVVIAHYYRDPKNHETLSNNRIKCIYVNPQGTMWIGTNGGGLNKLVSGTTQFIHYSEQNGLPDNTIYGILPDDQGFLWLSTNQGLSRFDPRENKFWNFGPESGLQGPEFNTGAFYRGPTGELFFGGIQGLTHFYPDQVQPPEEQLVVVPTDVLVENRPVRPGTAILKQSISEATQINLKYNHKLLAIKFSAMNFLTGPQMQYRYQLQDLNSDWVYTDANDPTATFTNLPTGQHLFQVQARRGGSARFGPSTQIMINVEPAIWATWWAYTSYVAILGLILIAIRRSELRKIQLKRELEEKRQETKRLNEMEQMRSRLIANVSHELRTPLTILMSQVDQLDQDLTPDLTPGMRKRFRSAHAGLNRVADLTEQLFELSRFATGKVKLHATAMDLIPLLETIVQEFQAECNKHQLKLVMISTVASQQIYIDPGKLEQIMFNLISNAVKFSTPKSTISIKLNRELGQAGLGVDQFARLVVENQGQGISDQALSNIFERFYQVDSSANEKTGGAGIGLALVKEMVELHGGNISVRTTQAGMTRFEFTLPLGMSHLTPEELAPVNTAPTKLTFAGNQQPLDPTKATILVVEDDAELRQFIQTELAKNWSVLTAENGEEGLQSARIKLPDMIISDINMPRKTGLELLKDIRNDEILAHVPVILLTGQTDAEDRLKGYQAQANDYINKPFKLQELKVRIQNILDDRRNLRQKNVHSQTAPALRADISKADEQFFRRVRDVINEHVSKHSFSVEQLAQAVFISRRQLERRLKDLTGLSPAEIIRQRRLSQAQQYLTDGEFMTVAEVATATGFKNVKYFSRLYRNLFGQTPGATLKPE